MQISLWTDEGEQDWLPEQPSSRTDMDFVISTRRILSRIPHNSFRLKSFKILVETTTYEKLATSKSRSSKVFFIKTFDEIFLALEELICVGLSPVPLLRQVNLDAAVARIKDQLLRQGTQPNTKDHRRYLKAYVGLLASLYVNQFLA